MPRLTTEEQMICDAIKDAIVTARPRTSITEVARHIGTTYDRLNNICNKRTAPDPETIEKVRDHLNLPRTWPHQRPSKSDGRMVSLAGTPLSPIPVVGEVSAGPGVNSVDPPFEQIFVPDRIANLGGVGFTVNGTSMMPVIQPGDVASFREHRYPRPGYPFLIRKKDEGLRIKIMEYDRTTDGWTLHSINPQYPVERLEEGDEIIGYLIAWYRSKGTRETMDSDSAGLILDRRDYFL